MNALAAFAGVSLVALIVWQVFKDLFHPAASGAVSDWVGRSVFRVFRHRRGCMPLAGPLAVVLTIGVWVAGLVFGFALIYLHSYPMQFQTSTGMVPPPPRLPSALYFSFETLITLGYGDLVPMSQTMRFSACLEALIGFGLLTASVSSIVLLYPAVARTRLLSRTIAHLVEAQQRAGVSLARAGADVMLERLATGVTNLRVDLMHFPMLYYFVPRDEDASVAKWTAHLEQFALEGCHPDCLPQVRLAARTLEAALQDLATVLAMRFLRVSSNERSIVFRAFAQDHKVSPAARQKQDI
jgi:hypothetical protein